MYNCEEHIEFVIYKITNKVNDKFYIGSAFNLNKRLNKHRHHLRNNTHVNLYLQNSWNKYGEDNFIVEVLENCKKEELLSREQYFIDALSPDYNICKKAGNVSGLVHTECTKDIISKKNTKYNINIEELISLYKSGLDSRDLAKIYGCTPTTVLRKLPKDIIRTKSQVNKLRVKNV